MKQTEKNGRNKGYTIMEILLVVGIIAILVIFTVPFVRRRLELSREATDLAAARAAYAEIMTVVKTNKKTTGNGIFYDNGIYSVLVDLCQKVDGWQSSLPVAIAEATSETTVDGTDASNNWIGKPRAGGTCRVEYRTDENRVYFYWEGESFTGEEG